MIGLSQMYCAKHKITPFGIEGYKIQKKYEQPTKALQVKNDNTQTEEHKRHQPKKGHYLEDYIKVHGDLPGPGVYEYPNSNWPSKNKNSAKKIGPKKKLTYIDEIIEHEKKEKRPAPGQYKLFKDDKEIKEEQKRLRHKKVNYTERRTYLDGIQYEASMTPGVGSYQTTFSRPKSATLLIRHKQTLGSRPASSVKRKDRPTSMAGYNPQFGSQHKSFSKKKKGYNEWGRVQRFKNERTSSNLGPGAYLKGQQDRAISKKNAKSIYY